MSIVLIYALIDEVLRVDDDAATDDDDDDDGNDELFNVSMSWRT
jgi:hypothetical protein